MIEIGRICVKIAGRDSGKKCVIVEILDDRYALIDGETRRRKCNVFHLEPLDQKIEIAESASHEDVISAFKEIGIEIAEKKAKEEGTEKIEKSVRPAKQRNKKEAAKAKEEKPKKKAAKKKKE